MQNLLLKDYEEIGSNILKHAIKFKIEYLEAYQCFQLDLSIFFHHYYGQVDLKTLDLSSTEAIINAFTKEWINLIARFHDDLNKVTYLEKSLVLDEGEK